MTTLLLLLLVLVVVPPPAAAQSGAVTVDGCACVGDCKRTLDGFLYSWCYTSGVDPPPGVYCGRFSPSRRAWWAECEVNVTGADGGSVAPHLTTFPAMATTMTVATVATCGVLYCAAGCAASLLISPRRTLLWLPWLAMTLGVCQGLSVGAPFAVIVAFLYLSLPYAIGFDVAVSLGTAVAVLVAYWGLGRHYKPVEPPHASEYAE